MIVSGRKITWGSLFFVLAAIPLWKPVLVNFLAPPGFEYLKKRVDGPVDRFDIHGMRFSRSRGGTVDTIVKASRAYGASLSGTKITMQDVSIVISDKAEAKILVESVKGDYYPDKALAILPGEFTVTSGSLQIKGKELHYDLETGSYRIEDGVVCDFNPA
ncbi:MAG: hypothetical protein ACQES8_04865 [Thermodesulfobacteriota bacterium]